ncbi:hypothetical protein ABZ864_41260 [Streptomyces sp. NPDC047082]|uniref:hypothetical protein n=1 Tax=Streptomyces sp. NPDC047082 TaxID=3155259 RepID=UPI0033FF5D02
MSEPQGQVVAVAAEPNSSPVEELPGGHAAGLLVGLTVPDGELETALRDQLAALRLWWPQEGGRFRWVLSQNPDGTPLATRAQVEAFLDSSGLRETEPDTPLVLFVSAHGLASVSARHYMRLPTTLESRLLATAVPTPQIAYAALDSSAQHVLVILNMCESSAVQSELVSLLDDMDEDRKDTAVLNVLATTKRRRSVMAHELAMLLTRAHELVTSSEQIARAHLTMNEFTLLLHRAAEALEAERPRLKKARKASAQITVPQALLTPWQHDVSMALPNPGFQPEPAVAESSVQEMAASYAELEYWLKKASGRLDRADGGWYFAGREALNRELVRFLRAHRGVMVLTGGAGSGKSAVLGRLVTMSDRVFRSERRYATALHCPEDTIPPVGVVTAAVSARNRTAQDVLQQLVCDLGWPAPAAGAEIGHWQTALEEALGQPGPAVTVVIDSLDEAYDPAHFIRTVLAPFVAATRSENPACGLPGQARTEPAAADPRRREVRLLLGVRSLRPGSGTTVRPSAPDQAGDLLTEITDLFTDAAVLRTDERPDSDIRTYVKALLAGQQDWTDALRRQAALAISDRAHGSFLHARLAVDQLRARKEEKEEEEEGPQLLGSRDWLDGLEAGIAGLLMNDVRKLDHKGVIPAAEALALLRATAFALGRGVAWGNIWPVLTEAVLQAPLQRADEKIRELLKSPLSGYLTSDHEDDRVVYRPAHEQLAQILRRWPADLEGTP